MARALYRKYRPKSLDTVVGQEQVTDILRKSLKQGKVSHAYLFVGPRGTGKTSVARIFAHEINKFKYELEDDYVDIIEIDGASNRGINDIRELREKAAIAPTEGKFKVYIIDEVHMFTKEAFNALLKTLEEPPEHVIFIMATTELHKVPTTILSRAQTYTFKLADPETMQGFLRQVSDQEKIPIADDALEIIVKRGGGSFRDSLSLLDQISTLSDQEITKELVISSLGLPEENTISELLQQYLAKELDKVVDTLKNLLSTGTKPEIIAETAINQILANPKPELFGLLSRLPSVTAPFPEAKLLVAFTQELYTQASNSTASGLRSTTISISANHNPTSKRTSDSNQSSTNKSDTDQSTTNHTKSTSNSDNSTSETNVSSANINFSWENFISRLSDLSDTIYSQLQRAKYQIVNNTLHIYPKSPLAKRILSSKNNLKVITNVLENLAVEIHDPGDAPADLPEPAKDSTNPTTNTNTTSDTITDTKPTDAKSIDTKSDSTTPESDSTKSDNFDAAKISAIMGGEIKEYDGEDPFTS